MVGLELIGNLSLAVVGIQCDLVALQHELVGARGGRARDAAAGRDAALADRRQRAQVEPERLQVGHQRHLEWR